MTNVNLPIFTLWQSCLFVTMKKIDLMNVAIIFFKTMDIHITWSYYHELHTKSSSGLLYMYMYIISRRLVIYIQYHISAR